MGDCFHGTLTICDDADAPADPENFLDSASRIEGGALSYRKWFLLFSGYGTD